MQWHTYRDMDYIQDNQALGQSLEKPQDAGALGDMGTSPRVELVSVEQSYYAGQG